MSLLVKLPQHKAIYQYLKKEHFDLQYSKPAMRHMVHFLHGATEKGFSGTLTDLHEGSCAQRHRTTLSHFLNKGVWNDAWLEKWIMQRNWKRIYQHAKRTGLPIYVLLDDSVMEKKKPSFHATHGIAGTGFHFSHTKGKSVWGHNLVTILVRCGNHCLPFAFRLYTKGVSRIELAKEMLQQLPALDVPAYLLMDAWYTCADLLDAAAKQGLQVVSGLKTNRILYPAGISVAANQFASHMEDHLVTVGDVSYHVYCYEGSLHKIPNAVVLFCWPEGKFGDPASLRLFLSTDVTPSAQTLLRYCACRWAIETFFQTMKSTFSMDRYQIRHVTAIRRFLLLLLLTYVYCEQAKSHISQGLSALRRERKRCMIEWIYTQAQANISLDEVSHLLRAS
jgi:hypothetical protein